MTKPRADTNKRKTPEKEKKDSIWGNQTSRLELYCKKRKWEVRFTTLKLSAEDDMAWPEKKQLLIRKDRKAEITFYYFLHEIGHMLLSNEKTYEETHGYHSLFTQQSQAFRVGEIEEEYEAWKAGYRLAKRLDLKINRITFEKVKSRCLTSYFLWALDRKVKKAINQGVEEEVRGEKRKRWH